MGIGDFQVATLENAQIGLVSKESRPAVTALVQSRSFPDLQVTGTGSSHFPGFACQMGLGRIGYPTRSIPRFPVSLGPNLDLFSYVTPGWKTSGMATFASCITQASLGIFADVFEVLLRFPVQESFNDRGKVTHVRDIIGQENESVSAPSKISLDERVVQLVTAKPPDVLEEDTEFASVATLSSSHHQHCSGYPIATGSENISEPV